MPKPKVVGADFPAKPKENPKDKFLRLGLARTQRAIAKIRQIGNLGHSGYESTPEQRERIITALFDAVHDVKRRLEKQTKDKPSFSFE